MYHKPLDTSLPKNEPIGQLRSTTRDNLERREKGGHAKESATGAEKWTARAGKMAGKSTVGERRGREMSRA